MTKAALVLGLGKSILVHVIFRMCMQLHAHANHEIRQTQFFIVAYDLSLSMSMVQVYFMEKVLNKQLNGTM